MDNTSSEAAFMLQNGKIDAYFFTFGHPDASLQEATRGNRKTHSVPIRANRQILLERPCYVASCIPVSQHDQQ